MDDQPPLGMNDSEPCNSDEVGVDATGIDQSTATTVDQTS